VVSTGAPTPLRRAVGGLFNFVAFLIFKTHVANTIAKTWSPKRPLDRRRLCRAPRRHRLNLITYYLAIPSSSSHALVEECRRAVAKAARHVLVLDGMRKIGVFIVSRRSSASPSPSSS